MTTNRVHFLHSSDWQLGMTRHYLAGEAQARFTADRIDTVRQIGELARRVGAEFVVVAGDVFEHANLARPDLASTGRDGEAGVDLLLPGNHDPLDAASIYRADDFRIASLTRCTCSTRSGRCRCDQVSNWWRLRGSASIRKPIRLRALCRVWSPTGRCASSWGMAG